MGSVVLNGTTVVYPKRFLSLGEMHTTGRRLTISGFSKSFGKSQIKI